VVYLGRRLANYKACRALKTEPLLPGLVIVNELVLVTMVVSVGVGDWEASLLGMDN
jgi:hypothetical protein